MRSHDFLEYILMGPAICSVRYSTVCFDAEGCQAPPRVKDSREIVGMSRIDRLCVLLVSIPTPFVCFLFGPLIFSLRRLYSSMKKDAQHRHARSTEEKW